MWRRHGLPGRGEREGEGAVRWGGKETWPAPGHGKLLCFSGRVGVDEKEVALQGLPGQASAGLDLPPWSTCGGSARPAGEPSRGPPATPCPGRGPSPGIALLRWGWAGSKPQRGGGDSPSERGSQRASARQAPNQPGSAKGASAHRHSLGRRGAPSRVRLREMEGRQQAKML